MLKGNKNGLKLALSGVGAVAGLLAGLAASAAFGAGTAPASIFYAALTAFVGAQIGWCAGFALGGEKGEEFGSSSSFLRFGASAALYLLAGGQPTIWMYTALYLAGGGAPDSEISSVAFRMLLFAIGGALGLTIGFMPAFLALILGVTGFGVTLLSIACFDGAWAVVAGTLAMTPFVVCIAVAALLKIPDKTFVGEEAPKFAD